MWWDSLGERVPPDRKIVAQVFEMPIVLLIARAEGASWGKTGR